MWKGFTIIYDLYWYYQLCLWRIFFSRFRAGRLSEYHVKLNSNEKWKTEGFDKHDRSYFPRNNSRQIQQPCAHHIKICKHATITWNVIQTSVLRGIEYDIELFSRKITPLLKELQWLPVRQRIIFKILMIVYKALNGQTPSYVTELLHIKSQTHGRSLRSTQDTFMLQIPPYKTKVTLGDRSFLCAAPGYGINYHYK